MSRACNEERACGLSSSCARAQKANAPISTPPRKGSLHPKARISSSEKVALSSSPVHEPRLTPNVADAVQRLPASTRWCAGALSMANTRLPTNSPPTESPCISRIPAKRIVASSPMLAYVGRHPMQRVDAPMSTTLSISACLRP